MAITINATVLNFLFLIGIVILSYDIHELKQLKTDLSSSSTNNANRKENINNRIRETTNKKRVAWIDGHGKTPLTTYMRHIVEVFKMMDYQVITGDQSEDVHWDVMWIHDYAFTIPQYRNHIKKASAQQIINHVPGSGYYTSKVSLSTAGLSSGLPESFELPKEKQKFLNYANEHPELLWVQKDNAHRNIKIRELADLDLDKDDSFIQRFVENPLLIDNRKFDLGIYTVVTSLSPLRVYLFDGDVLIRFCAHEYEPFDVKDVDKYVVGDDYTPIWEIDSLKPFYSKQKMGWRDAFDSYLRSKGMDPMKIWSQIGATIAEVFQRKQSSMLAMLSSSPINARFFELSRFDFVVDEHLNVYLMEANMSPNLSSGHFKQNQLLYEQVVMNVLSLVGIASQLSKEAQNSIRSGSIGDLEVSDRDLLVSLEECWNGSCRKCDAKMECQLCGHCLSDDTASFLRRTYQEHLNRRRMILVVFDYTNIKPLTKEDHLLSIWRRAKCQHDSSWC